MASPADLEDRAWAHAREVRACTSGSATALSSLERLAELPHALVLPGHGEPFILGTPATRQALEHGAS